MNCHPGHIEDSRAIVWLPLLSPIRNAWDSSWETTVLRHLDGVDYARHCSAESETPSTPKMLGAAFHGETFCSTSASLTFMSRWLRGETSCGLPRETAGEEQSTSEMHGEADTDLQELFGVTRNTCESSQSLPRAQELTSLLSSSMPGSHQSSSAGHLTHVMTKE